MDLADLMVLNIRGLNCKYAFDENESIILNAELHNDAFELVNSFY